MEYQAVKPIAPFANGRGRNGRFLPGNPGGPGNPHARHVSRLRAALLRAVTPADMREIATVLKERARGGDIAAATLLLGYVLGKPASSEDNRASITLAVRQADQLLLQVSRSDSESMAALIDSPGTPA